MLSAPIWLLSSMMALMSSTYKNKSSTVHYFLHTILNQTRYKMSGASQIEESSCLLLLSNQPTTILSPEALCNLDNSEWDKLTRSNLAEPVIEYLDKLLDKNDGKLFYNKVKYYLVIIY